MYKTVNPESGCEAQMPISGNDAAAAHDTSPRFNNASTIEVITGPAVIHLLMKPEFQKKLDLLFVSCPWATVFQSSVYITAWYQVYRHKHLPLMVLAVENGQLTGMLPMVMLDTQSSKDTGKQNRITGAGHYDAEYQSWLAAPAYSEVFIKAALEELLKQFPGHPITFRYLPPATPLHWLKTERRWRRLGVLQSHTRPLIDLSQPDHAKLLKSKQFRNKLNRLKRLGELQLESITDLESFKSSLDELAVLYDFRFSALYNKHHFKNDPAKKELLLQLFRLQLLHVTILKVNGKTFAAVAAIAGENWVYLSGFSCHSPFKARSYSPGIMHFLFLAKRPKEENIQYFDLTPGYDSFKETLANEHDKVHELLISSAPVYRLKKRIRKWMHLRLLSAGIRPMTAEVTVKKFWYRLKNISLWVVIQKLAGSVLRRSPKQCYVIPPNPVLSGVKIAVNKDDLNDLLQFRAEKGTGITRWDFLADAMCRLETGQHCYTWMENDRLLSCAWFTFPEETETDVLNGNVIELRRLYCHGAGKNHLHLFLYSVIDAAINVGNGKYFISNDPLFCQALEAIGFNQVN
ncbi:GNAT family N-acetyltransferase [Longitalea luteola]|uniref:GNAT family N-acetyltransferase n=1 Tax=Longitalea luteola TaxID=2812563 RepID=UPI001A95AD00|nr:GNAT family N-acetyltransferase [Longitalea luteola]